MEGNTKRPTITLEQDPTTKTWEALIESKRKRTRGNSGKAVKKNGNWVQDGQNIS